MKLPPFLSRLNRPKLTWPFMMRRVQGHSMMPILPPRTVVIGWRWMFRVRVGDVIIFAHDNKEKIKRVAEANQNKLYVLGDHPPASTDSRDYGWIDKQQVLARVIWPHSQKVEAEKIETPSEAGEK